MGNQKIKIKTLLLVTTLLAALSFKANAATAPDITYRSGTASPYSSAKVEYTTAGTYSWTVPTGVSHVKVTTVGAGGGAAWFLGSTGNGPYVIGFGGGGGNIVENTSINVSAGQTITVTVGAKGSGGTTATYGGSVSGSNGGDSYVSYGGTTYSRATGGKGATYSNGNGTRGAAGGSNGGIGGGTTTTTKATGGKYGARGLTSVVSRRVSTTVVTNIICGGGGGSWGNGASSSTEETQQVPTGCSPATVGGGSGAYSPELGVAANGAVFINYIIDPTVSVTGVSLNQSSLSLTTGSTSTLTATVAPSNATNKTVTWSSSNTAVATVSNGTVTAIGNGTATITATTADGGYRASCTVTVTTAVSGISVTPSILSLNVGNSGNVTATVSPSTASNKDITWSSSNSSVATVSNGTVSAVAPGTATITARTNDGGKTANCTVTVKQPLKGISLSNGSLSLVTGATATLIPTFTPEDASNKTVSWSSSNPAVATVINGTVRAIDKGVATITVTAADGGYTASCIVMVSADTRSISLKIIPEVGPIPTVATLGFKEGASSLTQYYPGQEVKTDGRIDAKMPATASNYHLGVRVLNSLLAGRFVEQSVTDLTSDPFYLITGDLNHDNVINGTDYTVLTQMTNFPPATVGSLTLTGDLNGDGKVDTLDRIIFNSPVKWDGLSRFLYAGYAGMDTYSAKNVRIAAVKNSYAATASNDTIIKIKEIDEDVYEISLSEDTPKISMLQISLECDNTSLFTFTPPPNYGITSTKIASDVTACLPLGTWRREDLYSQLTYL